jgi:hypothetical protein
LDPLQADRFSRDFGFAQANVLEGVSPGRDTSSATAWAKWIGFTSDLGLNPFLKTFQDKVPFLQIFAGRVHSGELAARGNPLKSQLAEDYVQNVAQMFLNMGAKDPRLNSAFQINFRIQRTLRAWKQTNPAPMQVKPIPITVIRRITVSATADIVDNTFRAAADMIVIAFFFLLRLGEYTDNNKDPFRLANTQLFIGERQLPILTALATELHQACFALLTFTSQKNGVCGKVIGLACSGNPYLCPVQAIIRQVLYLQSHSAPPSTPLARVFNTPHKVTATFLTACIRKAVTTLGPDISFLPSKVSA